MSVKTRAVNIRLEKYDVYIGRPSKWGNPFKIGSTYQGRVLTRQGAVEAFEDWFENSDRGRVLQRSLPELKGKKLGCFCKPKPCHGDILARKAEEL